MALRHDQCQQHKNTEKKKINNKTLQYTADKFSGTDQEKYKNLNSNARL